jgi:hypothetical protein
MKVKKLGKNVKQSESAKLWKLSAKLVGLKKL